MVDLPPRETGTIWSTCSLTPSALPRPHLTSGHLRMLGIVRHAAVLVFLPPLLTLLLTLALPLCLLMLAPEHIEHGLYAEQDDGEREERHHGIGYLIHVYPFGVLGFCHAQHT